MVDMKIFIGKKTVEKYHSQIQGILFENAYVIISGPKNQKSILLNSNSDQFVGLFGSIHALDINNQYQKFSLSKSSLDALASLFSEKGLSASKNLEGHFIGVFCEGADKITVFADHLHRSELFYSKVEDGIIAATTLEDLMVYLGPNRAYDQTSLSNLLSVYGNYAPKKQTIYKDIKRLGVNENLQFTANSLNVISTPHVAQETQAYGPEKLHEYSQLFRSAVEVRSSSSKNWIYMSSGWDSSSVLAMLCDLYGPSKIHCVIGRCKYSNRSGVTNEFEIQRAKKITEFFSVPLDVVDIDYTGPQYLSFWNTIRTDLKSLHLYSLYAYNMFMLGKHISSRGTPADAVFNGEISDGAHSLGFSQYATILNHPDLGFREYSDKMISYLFGPSFFELISKNKFSQDIVFKLLKSLKDNSLPEDLGNQSESEWKKNYISSFFLSGARMPFSRTVQSPMLTSYGREHALNEICETYFSDFASSAKANTIYSWMLHLYNSFHWQAGTVRAVSSSCEHYQFQNSSPFWDSKIQNFLSKMPESWGRGLDLNPTKYPLKWTLQNKIRYPLHLQTGPHSYLYDINPSWSVDADIIYDSAGVKYFREILKNYTYENILDSKHFDLGHINKLVDGYINGELTTGQDRTDLRNLISLVNVGWY